MRKFFDITSILLILGAIAVFLFPSSIFIRVIGLDMQGRTITFARELPYGDVYGEFSGEIVREDGMECHSGPWQPNHYQVQEGNVIVSTISEWAWPCVDLGAPYYIRYMIRVRLFGLIPLRPFETVAQIERTGLLVPLPPPPKLNAIQATGN